MTAAALRFAPPFRCHRELGPGEVKRIATRLALVGYYLRCPGCRALLQAPAEAFVETPPLVEQPPAQTGISGAVKRPTALATVDPIRCTTCRGAIVVRDERVELVA